ncbi:RipA family octameric membrane protein [Nocardia xishanensis]|uniref:RipA family octameric membrane protein n=1 Tax=Nocardia xishanensis TaxID=238964 RepID=UPI0033E49145
MKQADRRRRGVYAYQPRLRKERIEPDDRNDTRRSAAHPGDQRSELRTRLWNDASGSSEIRATTFESAVLEQYRLCVEMADRVSARRGLANSFFLTLNTGIFTFVAAFGKAPPQDKVWWLAIPLAAILGQCFAWFSLVRSYRLLNCAKYQVVGALEERLPASPFWRAEWWALGEGKDRSRYWPLSHIEEWIPLLFAIAYTSGFLAVVLS